MDRELIKELFQGVMKLLNINTEIELSYQNKKDILNLIKEADIDMHSLISKFISSMEMYNFVKIDKELRIKAPEMHESECIRLKNNSLQLGKEVLSLFKDKSDFKILEEYCED